MLTEARLSWNHPVLTWLLKEVVMTDAITLNTSGCAEGFCFLLQMPYCILCCCATLTHELKPVIHPALSSFLPSLINPTLMDFVPSCFALAVEVHYTNKMFLVIWQNYLSSLAKSKGFNKEIKLQEIRKVRKLLQESSLLDDSLGTGVGWWSFPNEWTSLTESWDCGFWCDIREEVFFTATQPLPHTANWTWQYKIWSFSSCFQNRCFLTLRAYLFTF